MSKRWKCKECGTITHVDELLSAPNPFAPEYDISGCPICFELGSGNFELVCDEPGCKLTVTAGFPTDKGYRNTCSDHYRKYGRKETR